MKKFSDYQLVQKSLENSEFFGELIVRYEQPLSRFLQRIGANSQEEREDLLQEVFLKIYTHLNAVDEDMSFSAWAYRIARNTFYDLYRKKSSRAQQIELPPEEMENLWNVLPDYSQNLPENFEKTAISLYLRKKISALPEIKRDIFVLFYLEEKSYKEISDILKVNEKSVATHLSRGKKLLRKIIDSDKKSPFID